MDSTLGDLAVVLTGLNEVIADESVTSTVCTVATSMVGRASLGLGFELETVGRTFVGLGLELATVGRIFVGLGLELATVGRTFVGLGLELATVVGSKGTNTSFFRL